MNDFITSARVRQRMDVIWLRANGLTQLRVAEMLGISRHTVADYENLYEANDGYVNAETVCKLLRQIKKRCYKYPVTLVMDNARYQRCHLVQDLAKALGIELLFLPPYSPNLNLIERYWKYLKGKLFRCRSLEKFELFCASIMDIIEDRSEKRKRELATLLVSNFQIFDNTVICRGLKRKEYISINLLRRFDRVR